MAYYYISNDAVNVKTRDNKTLIQLSNHSVNQTLRARDENEIRIFDSYNNAKKYANSLAQDSLRQHYICTVNVKSKKEEDLEKDTVKIGEKNIKCFGTSVDNVTFEKAYLTHLSWRYQSYNFKSHKLESSWYMTTRNTALTLAAMVGTFAALEFSGSTRNMAIRLGAVGTAIATVATGLSAILGVLMVGVLIVMKNQVEKSRWSKRRELNTLENELGLEANNPILVKLNEVLEQVRKDDPKQEAATIEGQMDVLNAYYADILTNKNTDIVVAEIQAHRPRMVAAV